MHAAHGLLAAVQAICACLLATCKHVHGGLQICRSFFLGFLFIFQYTLNEMSCHVKQYSCTKKYIPRVCLDQFVFCIFTFLEGNLQYLKY